MPSKRPAFQEILNRVGEDIHTSMSDDKPLLRRSCEETFGHALAAESHGLHGAIVYAQKQSVPSTADDEETILGWARTMLPVPRKPATRASGPVYFTGTNGAVFPVGHEMSLLLKAEVRFRVTVETTVAGGAALVPVEAMELGAIGNGALGAKVVLTVPIAGVNSVGTIGSPGVTGGFDIETIESVQERVIHRFRNPPRGGVPADFEAWAREVPGVDKAWGIPRIEGIGTIGVAIVTLNTLTNEWDVPSGPLLAQVQAHIDSKAPDFMRSHPVIAPTLVPVDFEIDLSPNTPAVRASVEAEIRDLLLREASLGGQAWQRPTYDDPRPPHTIPLTHVTEAISTAAGENDHALVAPVGPLVAQAFELIVPGAFTFDTL